MVQRAAAQASRSGWLRGDSNMWLPRFRGCSSRGGGGGMSPGTGVPPLVLTAFSRLYGGPVRIAELVLKYVQALAWPATAMAITFLFRQQLRQILLRLTRVEAAGASMEFAAATVQLSRQAEAVEASLPTSGDDTGSTSTAAEEVDEVPRHASGERPWVARLEWTRAIVNVTPRGAVDIAREELEKEFERAIGHTARFVAPWARRDALRSLGLSREAAELYERFIQLTDAMNIEEIPANLASELLDTAETLLRAISEAAPA